MRVHLIVGQEVAMPTEIKVAAMTVDGIQSPLNVTPRDKGDGVERFIIGGKLVIGEKRFQINGHITEIRPKK